MVDPSLNWIFDIIGGSDWPQGDEDKLRALADEWDAVAAQVQAVGVGVPALTNKVTGSVGGTVGRHFFRYGQQLSGFEGDLASMAGQQAQMLRNQALNVENAKYSMIIQLAFTAAEIIWAIADPFTMPLVPEFLAEGLAMMRALRARFGQGMHLILEAVDEGAEEIFQDLLAQLIQIGEGNRHGIDGQSVAMSAAFGAGAGAFAHVVKGQLQKYSPKFAGSWKGAATVEGVTELGVGAVSIPLGGDPSGLGWSVLNGGLSGAASHGAHKLGKNLHDAYTGAAKPGPHGPAGDGKANLPGVEPLAALGGSPGSGLGGVDAENPPPTFVAAPPYSAAVAGADGGLLDAAPPAYTPVVGVDSPRVTGPPVVGATAGSAGSGESGSSGAVTRESAVAGDSPVPTTNARPPAVSGDASANGPALVNHPDSSNATPTNITTPHRTPSSHLIDNGGGIPSVHTASASNTNNDLPSSPDTSPIGHSTSADVDAHLAASNNGLAGFVTSIVATTHATDIPLSATEPLVTPSPAVSENPTIQSRLDIAHEPNASPAFTASPLPPTTTPTAGADRALTGTAESMASDSTFQMDDTRPHAPVHVMNPLSSVASSVSSSSLGQAGASTVADSSSTAVSPSWSTFQDATSQPGSSVSAPRAVESGLSTASRGSTNVSPISADGGLRRSLSTPKLPTAGSIHTSTDVPIWPAKSDIAQALPKKSGQPVSLASDGRPVQQLKVPSSEPSRDSEFYSDLANDVNLELMKTSGWEGGTVTRDAVARAVDANRNSWSYQSKNSKELAWHIAHYFVTAGKENRPRLAGGAVGDELETGVELDHSNEQTDGTAIVPPLESSSSRDLSLSTRGVGTPGVTTQTVSGPSWGENSSQIEVEAAIEAVPSARAIHALGGVGVAAQRWRQDAADPQVAAWSRGDIPAPLTEGQVDHLYDLLVESRNSDATLGGVWDWVNTVLHIALPPEEILRLRVDHQRINSDLKSRAPLITAKMRGGDVQYIDALEKLEVKFDEKGVRLLPKHGKKVDGVRIGALLNDLSLGKRKAISRNLLKKIKDVGFGRLLDSFENVFDVDPKNRPSSDSLKLTEKDHFDAQYAVALSSLAVLRSSDGVRRLPPRHEVVNGISVGELLYDLNRKFRAHVGPVLAAKLKEVGFEYLIPNSGRRKISDADYADAVGALEVYPPVNGKRPLPLANKFVNGIPVGRLLDHLKSGVRKKAEPVLVDKLKEVGFEYLLAGVGPSKPTDADYAAALDLLDVLPSVRGRRPLPLQSETVEGIYIGKLLYNLDKGLRKHVDPVLAAKLEEVNFGHLVPNRFNSIQKHVPVDSELGHDPASRTRERPPKRRPTEVVGQSEGPATNRPRRDDSNANFVSGAAIGSHVLRDMTQKAQNLAELKLPSVQLMELARSGLIPVEVARDGDCLMNAIIVTAGFSGGDGRLTPSTVVRRDLAAALRADLQLEPGDRQLWTEAFEVYARTALDVRVESVGLTDGQRERIIWLMETPGLYDNVAGDLAPLVAARRYNLDIHIHSWNGRSYSLGAPGLMARRGDLVRLDRVHSGVDHWMGTAPLAPTVNIVLGAAGHPPATAAELQSVAPDLADLSAQEDGGLPQLAAWLIVARREIDPMLLTLEGTVATTTEIVSFLPNTALDDFISGSNLAPMWEGILARIIAQRSVGTDQTLLNDPPEVFYGFDDSGQGREVNLRDVGNPSMGSTMGAPDWHDGRQFYGGPGVDAGLVGPAGPEISEGFGVTQPPGSVVQYERSVRSASKRSLTDSEIALGYDPADGSNEMPVPAKRLRLTEDRPSTADANPLAPGSVADAVLSIAESVPTHLVQAEARPWLFSSERRAYSLETFHGDSVGAIRFVRDRYQDVVGSNSVRFHAGDVGYMVNCVNVAVGVVERLSGRQFDPFPADGPRASSVLEWHFGGEVQDVRDPDEIVEILRNAGRGAHGIVFADRQGASGHVFNVLNDPDDGAVVFLDAQSGRLASVSADVSYRFLLTSGIGGDVVPANGSGPAATPLALNGSPYPDSAKGNLLYTIAEEPDALESESESESRDDTTSEVGGPSSPEADLHGDNLVELLARAIDSGSLDELVALDSAMWWDETNDELPEIRVGGDSREIVDALAGWDQGDYDVRFLGQLERVSRQIGGRSLQDVVPDIAERWLAGRFRNVVGVRRDFLAAKDLIDRISSSPQALAALAALLSQLSGAPAVPPRDVVKNSGTRGVPPRFRERGPVVLLAAAVEGGALDGLAEMDTDWLWDDGASPNLPQVRLGGEHDEILEELAGWEDADYDPGTLGFLERSSRQHHGRSLRDVVPDIAERWLAGRFQYLVDTGGD